MTDPDDRGPYSGLPRLLSYDPGYPPDARSATCHRRTRDRCRHQSISYRSLRILIAVDVIALALGVAAVVMVTFPYIKTRFGDPEEGKSIQAVSSFEGWPNPDEFGLCYCADLQEPANNGKLNQTPGYGSRLPDRCHVSAIHFRGSPPGSHSLGTDGAYVWWTPATWYRHLTGFHYNHSNGHVTVRQTGLYFIYSQLIHLENVSQTYAIVVNNRIYLSCTKAVPLAKSDLILESSCYTGGAVFLKADDQVWIRGVHTSGQVLVRTESTFWGLVKMT